MPLKGQRQFSHLKLFFKIITFPHESGHGHIHPSLAVKDILSDFFLTNVLFLQAGALSLA